MILSYLNQPSVLKSQKACEIFNGVHLLREKKKTFATFAFMCREKKQQFQQVCMYKYETEKQGDNYANEIVNILPYQANAVSIFQLV